MPAMLFALMGTNLVGDPAAAGQVAAAWWEPAMPAIPRQRASSRQAPIAAEAAPTESGSHRKRPRKSNTTSLILCGFTGQQVTR